MRSDHELSLWTVLSVNGQELGLAKGRAGSRLIHLIGFALQSKKLSSMWLGQGCAVRDESYRLQDVWPHAGRSTAPVMTKSSDRP